MSLHKSIPAPGSGRIMLALLAVVPAAMAYPWGGKRDYWVLGIAAVVVILLFGWWHGLHFTTILRRRLAMMMRRRRSTPESGSASSCATWTTVLLRLRSPAAGPDMFPLALITRHLNCYGIRADTIRITSDAQETWVRLTVSAAANLAALQARSSRIPLEETAQVAARRLADYLREIGWEVSTARPDEMLPLLAPGSRESWRGVGEGDANCVAAYRVSVDEALPDTLAAIRSQPASEVWTALEIAGDSTRYTIAAACAFKTEAMPEAAAPLIGLIPQHGNHLPALMALDPLSTRRLDGHTGASVELLKRLDWPILAGEVPRATEAVSRA